ncbi:hypothetical protein JKP88DRAFT_288451 [Tribonema minus]|uniref:Uncharacterized protein n=1 Tax=Tribonema minus TaxID=303371 RepID=A0A835Z5S0_9STRA|nr:hypothetical protein JKP88DRAFT_288451 [Tribonema minus]
MAKKIKKQDRLRQVLEAVYTVDRECHIRYEGGCVPNADKHHARVDFHVVGIVHLIVIIECDEGGHVDYLVRCELTRMEQVHEGVLKAHAQIAADMAGETEALQIPCPPVLFVRFNPDNCTVDGAKVQNRRKDREAALMRFLNEVALGQRVFTETLNIVYIGYDMEGGEPSVCKDPDYSEQMKACVRGINTSCS